MSNRTISVLVAGAFAAALASLTAPTVLAQGMDMEKMMKQKQAETMKSLKTGKFEKCYGVALKGHYVRHVIMRSSPGKAPRFPWRDQANADFPAVPLCT